MTTLQLTGWREGIKTVSLIRAMNEYSVGSLADSKRLLEELLEGKTITLQFGSVKDRDKFRSLAEECGAIVTDTPEPPAL